MKFFVACSLVLSSLLSSCVAVAVVGAAAGIIVYDKRTISVIENDTRIFHNINTAIVKDPRFHNSRVEVISFNQIVLLVGQVPSAATKLVAERVAQQTPRVTRVYNELTVGYPLNLTQRAQDSLLTGEMRSRMLNKKGLESGSIRVVTENAVVYLMGVVTHEQADLAVMVARQVNGVRKVIKIFRYI